MIEESKKWEALKAGDIHALQALYNHHADALYRYGMVLCQDGERVKDCIHDLFLWCWQKRAGINIPHSGKAYLLVSLRRRIFDTGPKSNLQTVSLADAGNIDELTTDSEVHWIRIEEEEEKKRRLEHAMSTLSDRQREIIHMKYFQQLDYEEIAGIMDLNYQSARNLVNRALISLRKEMLTIALMILLWM